MSEIKLSVIIPVYNVQEFLPHCLDSVLNQSFQDMEIIAVNDGATDESGEILASYAGKHEKIKVIEQQNAGLSAARNTGLDHSNGTYIAFVDSDDFVHQSMFETLYKEAIASDADIVKCAYLEFDDNSGECLKTKYDFDRRTEISDRASLLNHYLKRNIDCVVWNGIYHHSLFRSIRFPKSLYYEDHYITPELLTNIQNRFVYVPRVFYYYRDKRKGAITFSREASLYRDKVMALNTLFDLVKKLKSDDILSKQFSSYFCHRILEYCNKAIFVNNPTGKLDTTYYPNKVVRKEVFDYALQSGGLKSHESTRIHLLRQSHKLLRFYNLLLSFYRIPLRLFTKGKKTDHSVRWSGSDTPDIHQKKIDSYR